jgi:hypothetical protein
MSKTPPPSPLDQNESWEQRRVQLELERAEEFAKLSPEKKALVLQEEKLRFEQEQSRLKKELGYSDHYDPAKAKASPEQQKAEQRQKEQELRDFQKSLSRDQKTDRSSRESEIMHLEEFHRYFNAAQENIQLKKAFPFKSVSVDDFGRQVKFAGRMVKLVDHSPDLKEKDLKPGEIWQRVEQKKTKPSDIGLKIEINMGEDKNNHLGLTNIGFEMSLEYLMEGGLSEKLSRFTNLVFFAAMMHERQNKLALPVQPDVRSGAPAKKIGEEQKKLTAINQALQKFSVMQNGTNERLSGSQGELNERKITTVAYSINNGQIWGTFDSHGAPVNPRELQEALDKINLEK